MAVQTKIFNFLSNIGGYRTVLTNRTTILNSQPVACLRLATREKLKTLPEKPKKPVSAFLRFSIQRRGSLVKEFPNASLAELSRMLAEEWKSVHSSTKEKYDNDFREEMKAYIEKNVAYVSNLTDEQKKFIEELKKERKNDKEKRVAHKMNKETNKPKRPQTAYNYFMQNRSSGKDLRTTLTEIKGEWFKLSPDERKRLNQMAEDDKKRYEIEMDAWEAKMIKEGRTELVRKATLESIKPKRPIQSKNPNSK